MCSSDLEEIAGALSNKRSFDPTTAKRAFTVMMSGYTAVMLLPEVLRRIRPIAPALQIFTQQLSHANVHRSLDEGTCDLAFGHLREPHPNLRISSCFTDRVVCIASTEHWGRKDAISLEEFAASHHASMGDTPQSMATSELIFDRKLLERGHQRRIAAHSSTPSAMARIVAATDLLGILSARLAAEYAQRMPLRIFPLPIPLAPFDVTMVWHERNHRDQGHIWIRNQFRRVASEMPDIV